MIKDSIYVPQCVDTQVFAHIDTPNHLTITRQCNTLTDNNGRTTYQKARCPRSRPYARNKRVGWL